MTVPKVRTFHKAGVRYYVDPNTGEAVPGVTSIIGLLDKSFLQYWAAKLVAETAVSQHELVAQMAAADPDGAVAYLKGVPSRYTKRAADRGSTIHDIFEQLQLDDVVDLDGIPADVGPYVDNLIDLLDVIDPEVLMTEVTLFSRDYRYAGSADAIWDLDGEIAVVDLKTGNAVHPETALQLSAYAHADYAVDQLGKRHEMPKISRGLVLHVTPEQWAVFELPIGAEVFQHFLELRSLVDWRRQENLVIGQPLATSTQHN